MTTKKQALKIIDVYQADLAREFEVAVSTISRWASGASRPHPKIQALVVASLKRRAANKYRAALNEGGIADIADSVSDVISMLRDDFNLTDEDENFNSSEDN